MGVRSVSIPSSAQLVTNPVAAPGRLAGDVVEGAADRARPAFDAVAEAHQGLLLLLAPLVDPGWAKVGAVFAFALRGAHGLVEDLDVGFAGVLVVLDREQLVCELLHQLAPNLSQTRHISRMVFM